MRPLENGSAASLEQQRGFLSTWIEDSEDALRFGTFQVTGMSLPSLESPGTSLRTCPYSLLWHYMFTGNVEDAHHFAFPNRMTNLANFVAIFVQETPTMSLVDEIKLLESLRPAAPRLPIMAAVCLPPTQAATASLAHPTADYEVEATPDPSTSYFPQYLPPEDIDTHEPPTLYPPYGAAFYLTVPFHGAPC